MGMKVTFRGLVALSEVTPPSETEKLEAELLDLVARVQNPATANLPILLLDDGLFGN